MCLQEHTRAHMHSQTKLARAITPSLFAAGSATTPIVPPILMAGGGSEIAELSPENENKFEPGHKMLKSDLLTPFDHCACM